MNKPLPESQLQGRHHRRYQSSSQPLPRLPVGRTTLVRSYAAPHTKGLPTQPCRYLRRSSLSELTRSEPPTSFQT